MAVLKPSINAFSLLESDDPGDTYLGDVGASSKVDAAASRPVNINKKQQPQPQMSVWKANKVKAEANAAKNKQQQQPAASKAKTSNSAANAGGKNRRPQQPAAASKVQPPNSAAANAGKYKKPQQPAASRAQAAKTAAADEQFQQHHPPAPVNFTQILFGNAYPSARGLIYKNRKQNATATAKEKEGGASGATTDDKSGVHANGAAVMVKDDCPAPVQEEPPAPVKPVLPPPPPPPPPSLDDSAQFPSLK